MPSPVEDSALLEFASLVDSFCKLVEAENPSDPEELLHRLQAMRASLYLGALLLPEPFALLTDDDFAPDPRPARDRTVGRYHAIAARIAPWFGERDAYRKVYDPYQSAEIVDVAPAGTLGATISPPGPPHCVRGVIIRMRSAARL